MYKVLEISLHSHKERRRSSQDCSTHTSNACLYLFGEWKFRLWNCSLRVALYSQSLAIFKLKRTLSPIKIFCSSNTKQFRHIQWVILYRKSDLMFIMICLNVCDLLWHNWKCVSLPAVTCEISSVNYFSPWLVLYKTTFCMDFLLKGHLTVYYGFCAFKDFSEKKNQGILLLNSIP